MHQLTFILGTKRGVLCVLRNLSPAVFLRWSFMPDGFCDVPVHLDDPLPPLMEFWSLNLSENSVCQLASCLELVLNQKTGSVKTSTMILNGQITVEAEC